MTERMLVWFYVKFFKPVESFLRPSLKKILGRNDHIWIGLKRVRSALLHNILSSLKQSDKIPHRLVYPSPDRRRPFGVNIVGNFGSETGVGEAVRSHLRALKAASIPYVINNIVDSNAANLDTQIQGFDQDNPHSVNLIHLNFDIVPAFAIWKKVIRTLPVATTSAAGFGSCLNSQKVCNRSFDYFN